MCAQDSDEEDRNEEEELSDLEDFGKAKVWPRFMGRGVSGVCLALGRCVRARSKDL